MATAEIERGNPIPGAASSFNKSLSVAWRTGWTYPKRLDLRKLDAALTPPLTHLDFQRHN